SLETADRVWRDGVSRGTGVWRYHGARPTGDAAVFVSMDAMDDTIGRREALVRMLCLTAGTCGLCVWGGLLGTLVGCYRAPVTGREQMIFFSEETEMSMGLSAYREVLREFPLSTNPETNA